MPFDHLYLLEIAAFSLHDIECVRSGRASKTAAAAPPSHPGNGIDRRLEHLESWLNLKLLHYPLFVSSCRIWQSFEYSRLG